jgi:hypothetical protein
VRTLPHRQAETLWSQVAFTVTAVNEYETVYGPTTEENVPMICAALLITLNVDPTVGDPTVLTLRMPATSSAPPVMP